HFSDNGVGFKQDLVPLVFRMFHRLSPNGKVEGQGVGLTIVKRLLSRMHGEIKVQSEEGSGATFTVILPMRPDIDKLSAE
ncbi:MAG TPA: ATP-binding protein, partial [Fibrobacteraceae bacterium]|nr:ATP-binding protein [Fibrobacteraceae bacterium]